jgi:hypothetical protein
MRDQGYVGDIYRHYGFCHTSDRAMYSLHTRAARILGARVDRRTRHGQHVLEDLVCQWAGAYNHGVVTLCHDAMAHQSVVQPTSEGYL